jgi:hypothetical protein
VHTGKKSNLEFGANAVSGSHENGLAEFRKGSVEHSAKATDLRQRSFVESLTR